MADDSKADRHEDKNVVAESAQYSADEKSHYPSDSHPNKQRSKKGQAKVGYMSRYLFVGGVSGEYGHAVRPDAKEGNVGQ